MKPVSESELGQDVASPSNRLRERRGAGRRFRRSLVRGTSGGRLGGGAGSGEEGGEEESGERSDGLGERSMTPTRRQQGQMKLGGVFLRS